MACYSWMAASFITSIVHLLHFGTRPSGAWESDVPPVVGVISAVLLEPLLESCVLIGAIELLRRLKLSGWLQIFLAAVILAGPHSLGWAPYAFIAMPGFTIQAAAYLYWRSTSRKRAFAVVVGIHALHNLTPTIFDISATGRT